MKTNLPFLLPALVLACAPIPRATAADEAAVPLPDHARAVWDLSKAWRESTPTRERICLNGLWRWQPAAANAQEVPAAAWGFFKVPGCWPGITDYMQKDSQTVFAHPAWKNQRLGDVTAAWHQRTITVPVGWSGRRILVTAEYLNSYAAVYVDGVRAGELHFPGGELDVTPACRPGAQHTLSLFVVAMPLKGVLLSYTDSASAREVKGAVARRGLCGDVYLIGEPSGPRLVGVNVTTSVRRGEINVEATFAGELSNAPCTLRARITCDGDVVKEFTSPPFKRDALTDERTTISEKWLPDRLWDVHTPTNTFVLELSLLDAAGRTMDTAWPVRFGFREFWINGRDFYLNGTRLFLAAVPFDNAQVGAAQSTYAAARESFARLQSFGINFVYTHNYDCLPGSHLSFGEILRAADDTGMLVALTQPHFSHYDWLNVDADQTNGYARHAEFYARVAQNHPSVVAYSMSHNATGYNEDMNPDMIDGIHDARDQWALRNVQRALRSEAIVKRIDPSRIVYHHASGNLGSMHPINFYPNFVPIQEMSDWFEHWATTGVKPAFLCEYGAPFTWDWTMYRGWFQNKREFGSAQVPWEFCLAEWNAQFFGDGAFRISEAEKANLRWEAKQFRAGAGWHRWDYPNQVGSTRFEERYPVFERYLTDNWRAFRTWGVSAISPWEHEHFWKLREGVERRRQELPVDWENLQRPGFSADYLDQRYERMDMAFERTDWIATPAAQTLLRNNRPLLAYLGGKPAKFTSKYHLFLPGETVEKQLIIINNSREKVACEAKWTLALPQPVKGRQSITVAAGEQARVPLRLELPEALAPSHYELSASFQFNNGETQTDSFAITVMPRPAAPRLASGKTPRLALWDPKGESAVLLKELGVACESIEAGTDLTPFDILVVGKAALTLTGAAPDISRVRGGLKVIVFEQTAEVLEQRFGFRVAEYGLRQVFPRVADHPALAGLTTEELRDWRGAATILPPRLNYELNPKFNGAPTVQWCGLPVTRLWRCGNQGNVASVLIEKPARGDFLPIVDGGFSLQYSPLLEYREGRGMALFCQVDVTGRTENEPAAATLARNLLRYVSDWEPSLRRTAIYVGETTGRRHLESLGIAPEEFDASKLSPERVLIVGPGAANTLRGQADAIARWLKTSGSVVAIGLDQADADAALPFRIEFKKTEHISTWFPPLGKDSLFAGVGPADAHNRDPRELPLVTAGAQAIGDGVLARAETARVVLCQLAPWQFESGGRGNLRRTHRRASFLVSRLLANLGVAGATPLLERFHQGVDAAKPEQRWLDGFYLDQPEEWDDPYRFFRW